jgi:CheY-like chemotaxis protein
MSLDQATILLVEDDPNDVLLMKIALESAGVQNPVQVVQDGKRALAYLEGKGRYADRSRFPLPYLVLLDLKLPHVMGLDVLKWLRQKTEFAPTIVLVLSASANPSDVKAAYRLGANAYLVKPSSLEKLKVLARSMRDFWLVQNEPLSSTSGDGDGAG